MTNLKDDLRELGFETLADNLDAKAETLRKTSVAYSNYDFVTQEAIDKFNKKLEEETKKENKYTYSYKALRFTGIKEYKKIPPEEALSLLRTAKEKGCFDYFEICDIQNVTVQKDPILFGRINGCSDRFVIAQWDDDVTVEQIKKYQEQIKI